MNCIHVKYGVSVSLILLMGSSAMAEDPASIIRAEDPATPKFSGFAPAADLGRQLKLSIADLEKAVATEEEFKGQVEGRFANDANTIALLALALGLHDAENPYQSKAVAVSEAAKKLRAAKDYAGTKKAIEGLKAAAEGDGQGAGQLKWGKVSELGDLMKSQVPAVNNKLKTNLRHFKKRAEDLAACAATMALIAENAKLYVGDTALPTEGKKWDEFAAGMRSAAVDLAAKAHAGDEAGAKSAMDKLDESCHACHKVFNPEK